MAKKTKKIRKASIIAEELAIVRVRMALDKPLNETLTKEFKAALRHEGINEAGNYHITKSDSYKVVIEELALPFALQRNLVKVDTSKVKEVFRLDENLRFKDPQEFGFEIVTSEKISPIKGNADDE